MRRGRVVLLTPDVTSGLVLMATLLLGACGKRGAPLPPLIKLPVAPAGLTAERRGSEVNLQFTVPAENTDRTRPANIERVEVYGFTGAATVTDDQLLKRGTRVGSVAGKAPRDPNSTTEPNEPEEEPDLEGEGLDQGAVGHVDEQLTPAAMTPVDLATDKTKASAATTSDDTPRPLVGPSSTVASRVYITVGINKRGRKGPPSTRVAVPLVPAPPPPSAPKVTYDETTITVTWTPPPSAPPIQAPATGDVLPARVVGLSQPTISYSVYEVVASSSTAPPSSVASPSSAVSGLSRTPQSDTSLRRIPQPETRLTKTPLGDTRYTDTRIEWGTERCYAVRAVETIGGLTLGSDEPRAACTKLVDTFPPAAPKGLTPVASQGAVSLIWDPNNETDLTGYIVLRGVSPAETLDPITPSPIAETTFNDKVEPGVRYVYAVQAVDKAGNVSAMSARVEETAR